MLHLRHEISRLRQQRQPDDEGKRKDYGGYEGYSAKARNATLMDFSLIYFIKQVLAEGYEQNFWYD